MRKRFHGLKKPKIRQTWNKYNLYNLSRLKSPISPTQTYFQQKWYSKAQSRAYHGETIREKHWQRMFRPTIRSVVSMNYEYLAKQDGSEEALGRGSGLDIEPGIRKRYMPRIPYMNMVYAPIENRLDTAVFRALFASSTRQARQFVVHGYVKVNGKKMIYPGYRLNPGDMFQVEPDRVLYATGAPKDKNERRLGRKLKVAAKSSKASEDNPTEDTDTSAPEENPIDTKTTLMSLLQQAKSLLDSKTTVSNKRKQNLRAFQRLVKRTLSRTSSATTLTDSLDAELLELTQRLELNAVPSADTSSETPAAEVTSASLTAAQKDMLKEALIEAKENPIDLTKPYATPWRPRDYMSAFAFVPRYLEVHHKICSAVYLRHPVARPGLGEVPTPFKDEINGLAFNWYLRRR